MKNLLKLNNEINTLKLKFETEFENHTKQLIQNIEVHKEFGTNVGIGIKAGYHDIAFEICGEDWEVVMVYQNEKIVIDEHGYEFDYNNISTKSENKLLNIVKDFFETVV